MKPAEIVPHLFSQCDDEGIAAHAKCPVVLELSRPVSLRNARPTFYVCSCRCHSPEALFAPGVPWSE
jgi:hypothetical protein